MEIARLLNIVYSCVQSGTLIRVTYTEMFRRYPVFTALLAINIFEFLALLPFQNTSREYYEMYSRIAWVSLAFRVAATCEAWGISIWQVPRIGKMSRQLAVGAIAIGFLGAFATGIPGLHLLPVQKMYALQFWHLQAYRYSADALFILCALAWRLNIWISHGVRPNARKHIAILSGYWFAQAVGLFFINNFRSHAEVVNLISTACASAFIGIWPYVIQREGEVPVLNITTGDTTVLRHLSDISRRVLQALD